MNYSLIVWGLVLLVIGILGFFYAEKLRRKDEIDYISFKLYIGSLALIFVGAYWLIIELSKIM